MKRFSLILLVLSLFIFLLLSNKSISDNDLKSENYKVKKKLDDFLGDEIFKNAHIGFKLVKLNGEGISENNPNKNFIPASTLKAITTATTLQLYSGDFQHKTEILSNGKIENGILKGDFVIKANGDPTFLSRYIENDIKLQIDSAFNNLKIIKIEGNIILDLSLFSPLFVHDYWNWVDIGNYYGASFLPINFMDNTYELCINSPKFPNRKVEIDKVNPRIPNLYFINEVVSSDVNKDNAYIYASPFSYQHLIKGSIPKNRTCFKVKGSMPEPHLRLGEWFIATYPTIFSQSKIKLAENHIYSNHLFSLQSPKLKHIVKEINHRSINMFAESCDFLNIKKLESDYPLPMDNKHPIVDFWEKRGIDMGNTQIKDGCGLSRTNFISPNVIVEILRYSYKNEDFIKSLPRSGESGTIKSFANQKAKGKIAAKSGFLNGSVAYCGFITSKSGEIYVFSIMVNNHGESASKIKKRISDLIEDIYVEL